MRLVVLLTTQVGPNCLCSVGPCQHAVADSAFTVVLQVLDTRPDFTCGYEIWAHMNRTSLRMAGAQIGDPWLRDVDVDGVGVVFISGAGK